MSIQKTKSMEMPSRFVFHEDAGHGWLEVPYNIIVILKLQDKISGYSYRKNDLVYLEEDCDAPLFIKAYLQHIGRNEKDFQFFYSICQNVFDGDNSPIRSYPHLNHF